MTIRYGSVCSGIEAATVAWHGLGWEPAWFSEIEPFPKAVLAHHYPTIPDLGNMNLIEDMILDKKIEAPDVLVGGTPCTSFSIAGVRKSMSDERGVGILPLTYVRIANAIDDVRSVRGQPGVITVWENVPGVLNTKDNAFGCLLGALAGEDVPLEPPGGRWKDAGYVLGPKRAAAWRCLDAQFFGLAQRRKRVFVVSGPRDWFRPQEVLFEWEGRCGDTPPSRETRKDTSSTAKSSIRTGNIEQPLNGNKDSVTYDMRGNGDGTIVNSLVGDHASRPTDYTPVVVENSEKITCFERHDQDARYKEITISPTIGSQSDNLCDLPLVMTPEPHQDVAATLTSKFAGASHQWAPNNETDNLITVRKVIPFDTTQVTSTFNYSNPKEGDPCHPLASTAHPPAAVISIQDVREIEKKQNGCGWNDEGISYTLDAAATQGVAYGCDLSQKAEATGFKEEISSCIAPGTHPGHGNHVVEQALSFKASHYTRDKDGSPSEICPPLTKEADRGDQDPLLLTGMHESFCVRRLMPEECEILQGFSRGYTKIPWKGKGPDLCPDGPRYKALGNSMATTVMTWVGLRINNFIKGQIT